MLNSEFIIQEALKVLRRPDSEIKYNKQTFKNTQQEIEMSLARCKLGC